MQKAFDTLAMSGVRATLLAAACTFVACGQQPQALLIKSAASRPATAASQTYGDWCSSLGLKCPPPRDSDEDKKLTAAHWKSLLKIGDAVGRSSTVVDLSVHDLNDDILTQTARLLNAEDAWNSLQRRLQGAGFTSLHLGGAVATLNFPAPSIFVGPSTLQQNLSSKVSFSVTSDIKLGISGVSVTGRRAGADLLRSLDIERPGFFMSGGDNTAVSALPINFVLDEAIGTSSRPRADPKPAYRDIQAIVGPLATWFSSRDGINIDVSGAPLQTVANEVPNLVTDVDQAEAIRTVLQKLNSVRSTQLSRPQYLFEASFIDSVTCVFNNEAQLQLSEHVALTNVRTLDNGDVSLTFDGIRAILGTGVLTLPADITRIDLTPSSIIIQELPLIGSYTINIDENQQPDPARTSFTCS